MDDQPGRPDQDCLNEAIEYFTGEDSDRDSSSGRQWTSVIEGFVFPRKGVGKEVDDFRGLSAEQFGRIVSAFAEYRPTVCAAKRRRIGGRSDEKILGLNATTTNKLLSCLVPADDNLDGRVVQKLVVWAVTSRHRYPADVVLEPVLRMTNCVLHYNLCSVEPIRHIYEAFFQALAVKDLRPILYDVIYKLTGNKSSFVTKWRVDTLLNLWRFDGKSKQLRCLLKRFQQLQPKLVPATQLTARPPAAVLSAGRIERAFAALWAEKAPIAGLGQCLPEQSLIPAVRGLGSTGVSDVKSGKEFAKTLATLTTPCRTLALLGSIQTFPLVMLNAAQEAVVERLSVTLYYTLHNEFFSLAKSARNSRRKLDLLCRVNQLQGWLQQGVPAVGRFLGEYLTSWNGSDFFIEVLKMVAYVQVTDFDELSDCILSPLRYHFNTTYSCGEQLLVLTYLSKLAQQWGSVECDRYNNKLNGPLPVANSSCQDPLASLSDLIDAIRELTESGFCQLITRTNDPEARRVSANIYANEVLSIFLTLSRFLIANEIPIRAVIPSSVVYFSLFGNSSVLLSKSLDYITTMKRETMPLCQRRAEEGSKVAQYANIDDLNRVTRDVLAVLDDEKYLTRGESIFRQNWEIDDDEVRQHLSLTSHPALLSYTSKFVRDFCRENELRESSAFEELCDETSPPREQMWKLMSDRLPRITEFLETFRPRSAQKPDVRSSETRSQISQNSQADSATTSGISSLKPSRRSTRAAKTLPDFGRRS